MNQAKAGVNLMNQPNLREESETLVNIVDNRDKQLIAMYEILQSLQDASVKAGRLGWTTEELEKTTVKELLFKLASNKVRFIHVPEGYRIEIKPPPEERGN